MCIYTTDIYRNIWATHRVLIYPAAYTLKYRAHVPTAIISFPLHFHACRQELEAVWRLLWLQGQWSCVSGPGPEPTCRWVKWEERTKNKAYVDVLLWDSSRTPVRHILRLDTSLEICPRRLVDISANMLCSKLCNKFVMNSTFIITT